MGLGGMLAAAQGKVGVAEVVAPRDLREIVRDIEALGYDEEDFRLTRVDALSSPITFLYQMLAGKSGANVWWLS